MPNSVTHEGFILVTGGRVWYQIVGSGPGIPLLVLHGGPGLPHDYLEPLASLADERPVVFYDQLGCGKSDRPDDAELWRLERFVEEVGQVRAALQLDHIHLLGHSWGSMLSMDYALTCPPGLMSVILASPILSMARYRTDLQRLRSKLAREVQDTLGHHEATGTVEADAYQAALQAFFSRHLSRLDPPPEPLVRTWEGAGGGVYQTMRGPSEFVMTGNLSSYERTERLPDVTVPLLFTCGRHDWATPEATGWYQSLAPGAQVVTFEQSAHLPHLEEPHVYLQTLRDFLHGVEEQML